MTARLLRIWLLAAALGLAGQGALAQSLEESVIAQLRQQGYVTFDVSHTLLGRLHVVALSPSYRREIVINPHTGEVLRDYITAVDGNTGAPLVVIPDRRPDDDGGGGGGNGDDGNGDDDDDDDGGNDDDDDDDGDDD